jgi:hypothetical protein
MEKHGVRSVAIRRPPKYVHGFTDRHGKARFYLRREGFKRGRSSSRARMMEPEERHEKQ